MNIVIWGAGNIGKMAYLYYASKHNVRCFVDSNPNRQGTFWEGIKVCAPAVLREERDVTVVIASKNYTEEIQEQLFREFGIRDSILFEVSEEYARYAKKHDGSDADILVRITGGIGNQMFQYAFGRCLEKAGKKVAYDLSVYRENQRKFVLDDVFANVHLIYAQEKAFPFYPDVWEPDVKKVEEHHADLDLLKTERGHFKGYWQSFQYVELVQEELRREFVFPRKTEPRLEQLAEEIRSQNAVSVHVRRGDYLLEGHKRVFADICTEEYYRRAAAYIRSRVPDARFYVFSDDMEWVKGQDQDGAFRCIDGSMFEAGQDWYDIYLMSCCQHNIVANSTFSWWGAWLNPNRDKIVIAPHKVVNTCDVTDFYPPEWIRM